MQNSLGETGCLGNLYFFWSGCLSIQFFNLDTHVSDLWDAMPRQRSLTRTHMWLSGRHATPEVTLHIPTTLDVTFLEVLQDAMPRQKSLIGFLERRRIFPGVISILSMYLRLHTWFAYHQEIYVGRFYLSFTIARICE